jgi:peptidoglycan/LPS O-acetylase OafA/YrhL
MNKPFRIDYLDSVRGIAAMMVVVYHFIGWKWSDKNSIHLLSTIFNGSDAVSFFFVLSGLVLSIAYFQKNNEIKLPQYLLKRFLRIYPAYIFTVLLNYIYWNRHTLCWGTLSDMFYHNSQQLWQEFFLVKADHKFYIPGWTLGVEMALSLFLPFLIIVARKNIKFIFILLPLSLYIGAGHLSMFTFHFCLGLLLAYYLPQIQAFNFKQSKFFSYRWVIAVVVWILFSIRHLDRIQSIGSDGKKFLAFWGIDFFHFTGLASFAILFFVLNNLTIQSILRTPFLKYIGKISYSIYLMHWLVVVYIMDHWQRWQLLIENKYVLFITMLLIAVGSTIILSTIIYYSIEKQFVKIANRLTKREEAIF